MTHGDDMLSLIEFLLTFPYDQENLKNEREPEICSVFGFGKRLSITEKLFGNKCQAHNKPEIFDPVKCMSL